MFRFKQDAKQYASLIRAAYDLEADEISLGENRALDELLAPDYLPGRIIKAEAGAYVRIDQRTARNAARALVGA